MINDPKKAGSARPVIDPAEYDFSGVPKNELESCLYYEYMRESEAIVSEVSKVKAQMRAAVNTLKPGIRHNFNLLFRKVTKHQGIMFDKAMIGILAMSRGFPATAWQKLSPEAKQRLLDFPKLANELYEEEFLEKWPMLIMDFDLKDSKLGKSTLNAWKLKRASKLVRLLPSPARGKLFASGFIQINLAATQDLLVEAFRDWLKANCPQVRATAEERRGRDSQRDPLNALGALRLRFHCRTLTEAQKLIDPLESKPNGMSYSDRTAWKRACTSAVKHFHTLLNLPDGQLPTHFTKGWQK